ncbi:prosaposin isoform X2 [Silurus meridionalis]|uniref:Uncharacterized protein n=1 Tax=Silurus meridionalis TaxID=175797 RepID=A0A8T0B624_SILME|nr:prosaposin isoform X2 [Silurus meridionalis]KAF7700853.1 hypothetical protein HF521_002018 [Silurus meridionalis]
MAVPSILLLSFLSIFGIANARILGAETVVLNEMNNIKNDEACQDCIHIIELLKHLLSDEDFQTRLKGTLEGVCDLLPEQIKDQCHNEMDKDLPLVLTFLVGLMNPGQMCTYLNLCEGEFKLQMEDILMNYVQKTITPTSVMLEASFPCKTCTYALNVLNCLLPTTETESVLISVLDEACSVLPMVLSGQCSRLVQRSLKKLFEVLLNAKSPNSICSVLRLCQSSLPLVASPLSDCDSCQTLVILSRLRLGSNATQSQVTSFMSSVCQSHPGVLPKCESFTQRYGEQLRWILGKEAVALDVCERVDLCVKSRRTEQGDVGDPCTLGPSYSCQDLQTAHTCGVISFCQMNVWK